MNRVNFEGRTMFENIYEANNYYIQLWSNIIFSHWTDNELYDVPILGWRNTTDMEKTVKKMNNFFNTFDIVLQAVVWRLRLDC